MSDNDVGRFFDSLTNDYTEAIERCFPRYREMLWAVMNYLPQGLNVNSVLELGCGTGNLLVLLREAFPNAALRLVDISGESLDVCSLRLGTSDALVLEQQDFSKMNYDDGSFDLVVSSIAIHHLDSAAKQTLFRRVEEWLTDDGIFCYADQCAGATDDLHARHIANWKASAMEAGSSASEWDMWMRHQAEHDHHDTLSDQLDWLKDAGFSVIDSPWRYLLWTVIQARK